MPPRKRAKASAASTPLADAQPKTPQPLDASNDLLNDPWADDQETQLFKSMMKWKPTGIHKHFRMISIHADMRSHGFATDDAPHTRIPGIWRKLHQLYDLRALDDRENSYAFGDDADPHDPEDAAHIPEFELPEEDYGELIWQSRFRSPESPATSTSPPLMPIEDEKALYHPGIGLLKDLPGGVLSQKVESAADAASAAASASAAKSTKNTRAARAAARTGKAVKGQAAKSTRAQAAVSDSVEEEDEDDEDDEEEEEEEEESSAKSEEETAPSTRRTNRSAAKAKPAPKRTRKR